MLLRFSFPSCGLKSIENDKDEKEEEVQEDDEVGDEEDEEEEEEIENEESSRELRCFHGERDCRRVGISSNGFSKMFGRLPQAAMVCLWYYYPFLDDKVDKQIEQRSKQIDKFLFLERERHRREREAMEDR